MKDIRKVINHYKNRIRSKGKVFRVYSILRLLVILSAIRCFLQQNYESVVLCILSLVLLLVPEILEEKLKVYVPPAFEIIIYLFIYASEILGEVNHFYTAIPAWDTILHTLNGFLCAAIGFSLIDILNQNSKGLNLSPIYLAIVAFCFSMTVGVIWEFIEFNMDQWLLLDMQKDRIVSEIGSVTLDPAHAQNVIRLSGITKTMIESNGGKMTVIDGGYLDIGIIDTMKDLLVNFIGAVVFSVFGFLYVSNRERGWFRQIAGKMRLRKATDME